MLYNHTFHNNTCSFDVLSCYGIKGHYPKYISVDIDDIYVDLQVDEKLLKKQKQRFLSEDKLKYLETLVADLEKADIVQRNDNFAHKHVANILLVNKTLSRDNTKAGRFLGKMKNEIENKYRPCVDLRNLNAALLALPQSTIPTPEVIFAKLSGKIVSTADITQGYFGLQLSENSKKYTNL